MLINLVRDAYDYVATRPGGYQEVTISAYQQCAPVMQEHWEGYRQNILDTLAKVKPAAQIVAEQDGIIAGTVLLFPAGTELPPPNGIPITLPTPEVRLLAVAPAGRGQGIGTAIIHDCLRRARQSGATALTLHTTKMMQVAMRMYERMGFARAPELDFYPIPTVTIKGYRFNLDDATAGVNT
ncbi:MAG: GNAT family N-acetyltransferase [Chloroflexi bacterium]|nr:GNAT family N-acetyltransferase [Chloroflexota bacterium]